MASSGIPPVCYVVDHAIEKKWPSKVSASGVTSYDPSWEFCLAQVASVRLELEAQEEENAAWDKVRSEEGEEETQQVVRPG